MPWRLREEFHWCDCGGRAVFLDVRADRYFCLPQEANAAFLRMVGDQAGPRDYERLDALVRRGLMIEDNAGIGIAPPAAIEMPQSDFPNDPDARAGLLNILRVFSSELWISWLLRRSTLRHVIEHVRRSGPGFRIVSKDQQRSVQALITAAAVTAFYLRRHDRCLVRGLAFHALCRKRGLVTKLVIGVVAHPFTAHCWVQLGDVVLVGGYEQARLCTPILVLE